MRRVMNPLFSTLEYTSKDVYQVQESMDISHFYLQLIVKLGRSERNTKFDTTEECQILSGRFFFNFVAFSKYPSLV